jgi:hypothetical protein
VRIAVHHARFRARKFDSIDLDGTFDNAGLGRALALWAVPVAATVVGDPPVPAVLAGLDVTLEKARTEGREQ